MRQPILTIFILWIAALGLNVQSFCFAGDKTPYGKVADEANAFIGKKPVNFSLKKGESCPWNGSSLWLTNPPCGTIENPEGNSAFQVLPANDDGSTGQIALPFSFNLYGDSYGSVFVNNNGNVSFQSPYSKYSSDGFPAPYNMVAPFWADVDTRYEGSGLVYYRVEATRLTVIWNHVGYYNDSLSVTKFNTFKLVITNGTDPLIGIGNNVAFYYGDMQWTTGKASAGQGGFYGKPATVGASKGVGNNACFFHQLGRFNQPGTDSTNLQVAGGVDYLDNRCFFFDATTVQGVTLDFSFQKYSCATHFTTTFSNPQNCQISSSVWNFGDGTTSTEASPLHGFSQPGTYSVSVTIQYTCGTCQGATLTKQKSVQILANQDLIKDTLVSVLSDSIPMVLQTSAATFSDAWPLAYENELVSGMNPYLNGSLGVWRNEGNYVYEKKRLASDNVKTATDGTFTLETFNWGQADLNAIPHWTKAQTQTLYSPFSYELENRDVLGIYTAALYDYGGHLPSANGVNTRNAEMAFTSFEYLAGTATGNWLFGNQALPLYTTFPVQMGLKNTAVVKASLSQLEDVSVVDVQSKAFGFLGRTATYQQEVEVICKQVYPQNPQWSIVVLKRAPFGRLWYGSLRVKNQQNPVVSPLVDTTLAHAGKSSLRIAMATTFQQRLLRLDSAKSYFLSAWVSVNNPNVLTPKLADQLGVVITFKNKQGTVLSATTLEPSGPVIEGWQQVRGTFTCPDKQARLELTFKPGSTGTAWYDDLRMHPEKGNMKSYVYDLKDYRLRAVLDEENFASFFYYDAEGNLYLTKKETEEGLKTISENVSYIKEIKP